MTAPVPAAGQYGDFSKAFLGPIHSYWRDHDEAYLLASAEVLKNLNDRTGGRHSVSNTQVVTFTGWLLPKDGFRLRPRELANLNPGYRVRVHRYARRELGRRGQLLRAGFRVVASGSRDLPQFAFRISNGRREPLLLPASNTNGAFQARHFPRFTLDEGQHPAGPPQGFLDSVLQAPFGDPAAPETWLAALVHDNPAELFEMVDSPHGQFLAREVARLSQTFPSQSRWADHFAMAASGTAGDFRSDLLPTSVLRPEAPAEEPASSSVFLPHFSSVGDVTRYTASSVTLPVPDPTWRVFENARVQDGGTVLVGPSLVVYENSSDPRRDFVSGQQYSVFGSQSHPDSALVQLQPPAPDSIDEAILLSGRNDANWFHWLIEYLPRVVQVPESIAATVPLLVSSRTPPTGLAALHTLTSRPIIVTNPDTLQDVGRLHVVAPPVQVLDTTRVRWSEGLALNAGPLRAMRSAWGLDGAVAKGGERIFLSRKSRHRGITNESRLARIAETNGLTVRDPGSMSFEEQRELFSTASLLVGASGAVMANYLMMSAGSRVLALTSTALRDFVLPAAIAQIAGVQFEYVCGPPRRPLASFPTRNDWLQSDFSVEPKSFESALRSAISESSRSLVR